MIFVHESADAQGNWSLCMPWDTSQKTFIWVLSSAQKKCNVNNNLSNFATCAEYYELLVVLIECDTSCFDQIGSWSGFRFHKITKFYVFVAHSGTLKTKLLLADRQTFRVIFAIMSPWRKVFKNLWMSISLGRRNNHGYNFEEIGCLFWSFACYGWFNGSRTNGRTDRHERRRFSVYKRLRRKNPRKKTCEPS